MDAVKTYLLSVLGAAMVCAIVNRFTGKSPNETVIKMTSGVFLLLTVLQPFAANDPVRWNSFPINFESKAAAAVQQGEAERQSAMSEFIKEKTTAYILQKARTFHANVTVEISLTDESIPIPKSVRISGNISPYAKQQLQDMLEKELGIAKEHQIWT